MSEEFDETDEEIEQEMSGIDDEDVDETAAKKPVKPVGRPSLKPKVQPKQIRDRYVAIRQPEAIYIRDTMKEGKESIVAHEFKDVGSAMASAKIMNDMDKIITGAGY